MKIKGIGLIVIALAMIGLLAGCSADALIKTSESMEGMGKAGMGKAGETFVEAAVTETDGFVSKNESYLNYSDPLFDVVVDEITGQEMEKAKLVTVKTVGSDEFDGDKALRELCASFVSKVGKATETSASDKALREALDKPYQEPGKTYGRPIFRKFGDALAGSETGSGIIGLLTMMMTMDGIKLDPNLVSNITNYIVPIPIQAYDTLPILNRTLSLAGHILQLVQYNKAHPKPEPEPSGSGATFDFKSLLSIPDGIAKHTGDRKYQTVGDKISVALLYDILDAVDNVFRNYESTHLTDPENPNSDVDFSDFGFQWIMKNCGSYVDRVVSDVNAIGYINGTHIDAAGIIGSYLSQL